MINCYNVLFRKFIEADVQFIRRVGHLLKHSFRLYNKNIGLPNIFFNRHAL